jgi:hypothetical protein
MRFRRTGCASFISFLNCMTIPNKLIYSIYYCFSDMYAYGSQFRILTKKFRIRKAVQIFTDGFFYVYQSRDTMQGPSGCRLRQDSLMSVESVSTPPSSPAPANAPQWRRRRMRTPPSEVCTVPEKAELLPVLWIRIRVSVPLTYGSGSGASSFRQ